MHRVHKVRVNSCFTTNFHIGSYFSRLKDLSFSHDATLIGYRRV